MKKRAWYIDGYIDEEGMVYRNELEIKRLLERKVASQPLLIGWHGSARERAWNSKRKEGRVGRCWRGTIEMRQRMELEGNDRDEAAHGNPLCAQWKLMLMGQ